MYKIFGNVDIRIDVADYIDRESWRAVVVYLAIALLFFLTMFSSYSVFVEGYIISKWYALIGGSIVCATLLLFRKSEPFMIDELSV